jgi:hypothetical protein
VIKSGRYMVLAVTPMESAELKSIFSDNPESIRRKLEHPPSVRQNGWDLPSLTRAEFVRGELIRVVEPDRMMVDLYRDGAFILAGRIDRDFLAWSDKTDSNLHPLAMIELTLNFTRFYSLVLADFRTPPKEIAFKIAFGNMYLANQKTKLGRGPVGLLEPLGVGAREAPADTWSAEVLISSDSYDPDCVAFSLIREVYVWFGHSEEAIPYTKDKGKCRAIDADLIASLR